MKKILTYDDYLNSTPLEIKVQLKNAYLYSDIESNNLCMFIEQFSQELQYYENLINDINFCIVNENELCKDTLKRYQEKARDILFK